MKKASFLVLLPRGNVLPFLLLLVVALSRAKYVDAWPRRSCIDADMVLKEGDVRITANKTREDKTLLGEVVYMWPEKGFMGIGLQAVIGSASGRKRLAAWFSKDTLFTAVNTARWWQLLVHVHRDWDHISFSVIVGDIRKVCASWVTSDNVQGLAVVGYGPSRWSATEPPYGCPHQRYYTPAWPHNPPTCMAHPPFTSATTPFIPGAATPPAIPMAITPPVIPRATAPPAIPRATPPPHIPGVTPTTMTTTTGVVVAVVAFIVAVVAAVVVVYCKQRRRSADENTSLRLRPAAPSDHQEMIIIHNSLYEPYEACRDGAAAGAPTEAIHVIENSLYEPFEAC